MNDSWSRFLPRGRLLLAILSGVLLACAFPNVGVAGFAWIAPGLMVGSALGAGRAESFRLGYLAGLSYYLSGLYWLLLIPYRWHGIPFGPALGWLALSGYLALYPAVWVWLLTQFRGFRSGGLAEETLDTLAGAPAASWRVAFLKTAPGRSWSQRAVWALYGAALWVALEMVISRLLSGFPWDLLGVSQFRLVPLIQIASVTGVYGVSFLVVWLSLSLVCAGYMVVQRPGQRWVWASETFIPILVVAVAFNVGFRQAAQEPPSNRSVRVAMVQPSIPQTLIWDSSKDDERFKELLTLSEQALTNQVDVLLWPEAAVPKLVRYDLDTFKAVTNLAAGKHVWMIIGSDDAELKPGSADPRDALYYNSSFLVSPQGRLVDHYQKRNLVMFGEYVPCSDWLPFLKWLTPIDGGFTRGRQAGRFSLTTINATAVVLICFEDIFPWLARKDSGPGGDFLVNLTNNGWFGEGAAQWQHAASAIFRAIENGLPLIRCSNNGLTCWVDTHGHIREIFHDNEGTVYGPGFMIATVPLPDRDATQPGTYYHRHGDVFGWTCVAVVALAILPRLFSTLVLRKRSAARATV